MADTIVAVTFLAVTAGLFLILRRGSDPAARRRDRADAVAKYVIATFLGTYGSVAAAALLVSPILVYGRLAHNQTTEEIFSVAVDRPYFPLQSIVAFAIGFALAVWLRRGKPTWVWIWPVAQVVISFALLKPESVMQSLATNVWRRYFNWDCACSATLLQWQVMAAVYTAIAFTLGALTRYGLTERVPDHIHRNIDGVRQ